MAARVSATCSRAFLSASERAFLVICSCTGVMRAVRAATRSSKFFLRSRSDVTAALCDRVTASSARPRQVTAVVMAASYSVIWAVVRSVAVRERHWPQMATVTMSNKRPRMTNHSLRETRRSLNFI
jgi:hypothetical protein